MQYVIIRSDGQYVAKPGSKHSYTKRLQEARIYPTYNAASADYCLKNEMIIER